jgi:hypothetical protein
MATLINLDPLVVAMWFERPDSAAALVELIEVLNEGLADNLELKRIFAISSRAIMGGAMFGAGDHGAVGGVGRSGAGGGDLDRGARSSRALKPLLFSLKLKT